MRLGKFLLLLILLLGATAAFGQNDVEDLHVDEDQPDNDAHEDEKSVDEDFNQGDGDDFEETEEVGSVTFDDDSENFISEEDDDGESVDESLAVEEIEFDGIPPNLFPGEIPRAVTGVEPLPPLEYSPEGFRVAMVCIHFGHLPDTINHFVAAAAQASKLVDFLVYHTHDDTVDVSADNVYFMRRKKSTLSRKIVKVLRSKSIAVTSNVHFRERVLSGSDANLKTSDVKPLYGALFEEDLEDYSHWGWFDLNLIVSPNLESHLSRDLLAKHHVISWPSENIEALHLSHQWTVFQNIDYFRNFWGHRWVSVRYNSETGEADGDQIHRLGSMVGWEQYQHFDDVYSIWHAMRHPNTSLLVDFTKLFQDTDGSDDADDTSADMFEFNYEDGKIVRTLLSTNRHDNTVLGSEELTEGLDVIETLGLEQNTCAEENGFPAGWAWRCPVKTFGTAFTVENGQFQAQDNSGSFRVGRKQEGALFILPTLEADQSYPDTYKHGAYGWKLNRGQDHLATIRSPPVPVPAPPARAPPAPPTKSNSGGNMAI